MFKPACEDPVIQDIAAGKITAHVRSSNPEVQAVLESVRKHMQQARRDQADVSRLNESPRRNIDLGRKRKNAFCLEQEIVGLSKTARNQHSKAEKVSRAVGMRFETLVLAAEALMDQP